MGRLSRKFRSVQVTDARRVRVLNNNSGSDDIAEGDGIVIVGGESEFVDAANTAGIHGIACADIPFGETGEMYISGVFEAEVEGSIDFAVGDYLYSAADQKVDEGAASDVALGQVVGADPADGATLVEFILFSQFLVKKTKA
jgi:predicted RecA/RadA family phage recombinase